VDLLDKLLLVFPLVDSDLILVHFGRYLILVEVGAE